MIALSRRQDAPERRTQLRLRTHLRKMGFRLEYASNDSYLNNRRHHLNCSRALWKGKSMGADKTFDGSILRVFEARAKPDCADSLVKKFATTSVDVVRNQPGNQGHFFGRSVSDEDDIVLFVSVWRDLNAVKTRFGDDWESSFLPPGYSELIEECSVKHFALRTDWHSGE